MSTATTSSAPSTTTPNKKTAWIGALILFVVSVGLYVNTLEHELVYDDFFLISPISNTAMAPVTEDIGAAFGLFGKGYWDGVQYGGEESMTVRGQALYRPLTMFIWGVTLNSLVTEDFATRYATLPPSEQRAALGQRFHLLNLIANAFTIVALFFLILKLFGHTTIAFVATLLFAAHPLHSEAVAYVAGLSDILTGLCVFLGTLLFLKAVDEPGKLRLGSFVLLLLTFTLGLFAKESAVLLLAVIGLTDLLRTLTGHGIGSKRRLMIYGSLISVFVGFLAVRYSVIGVWLPQADAISRLDNVLARAPTDLRVVTSFGLVSKYLWLTLWPETLSMDYSFPQIILNEGIGQPGPLAGLLLSLAMVVVGLVKLRSWPALGFGLLLFLGPTIFFSNMIVPIGTVFAERLTYLPSAGVAIAVAALLVAFFGRRDRTSLLALQPLGMLIALGGAGALGVKTVEHNKVFRTTMELFVAARDASPKSARVHHQVGSLLAAEGLYDDALASLKKALKLDSEFLQSAMTYANVLTADEQFDAAVEVYEQVLGSLGSVNADGSSNAGVRSILLRRLAETKRASGDFEGAQAALGMSRDLDTDAAGKASADMVTLLQSNESWAESLSVISDALAIEPDNPQFLFAQARAAVALQDIDLYESSLQLLEQTTLGAVTAEVMRAEVQFNQASRNLDSVGLEEATAVFERVARDYPGMITPHVFLGQYLMDVARDPDAAMVELDKALELDPLNADALKFTAIAQLDNNDVEGARKTLVALGGVRRDALYWSLWSDVHFALNDFEQIDIAEAALIELGENPIELALNKAVAARNEGRADDAIEILDRKLVTPGNEGNVRLLVTKGSFLMGMNRFDEALLALDTAEASFGAQPDIEYDEYLPIRRAACLMALGRDVEAAGELERSAQRIAQLEWDPQPIAAITSTLLQRRAQLYARPDGMFHDLPKVEELCQEGLLLTQGRFPPFFDISIEAFVQAGDLDAAIARSVEGSSSMTGLPHEQIYALATAILEAAKAGEIAELNKLASQSAYPLHLQLKSLLGN